MKGAVTNEKMKEFAKEISRNPDLVYELGLMQETPTNAKIFVAFSEELQEAWFEENKKEKFYEHLRRAVVDEIMKILLNKSKLKYLTLVKYSYIFNDHEFAIIVKHEDKDNVRKIFIIKELISVLETAKVSGGEAELESIVQSARRIFIKLSRESGKA